MCLGNRRYEGGTDKASAFSHIVNSRDAHSIGVPASGLAVFIGDSPSDLLPLLAADIGIIVGSNSRLLEIAKFGGVTVRPLCAGEDGALLSLSLSLFLSLSLALSLSLSLSLCVCVCVCVCVRVFVSVYRRGVGVTGFGVLLCCVLWCNPSNSIWHSLSLRMSTAASVGTLHHADRGQSRSMCGILQK
jgi:hypothetical protein